jgi:hypothetical protein
MPFRKIFSCNPVLVLFHLRFQGCKKRLQFGVTMRDHARPLARQQAGSLLCDRHRDHTSKSLGRGNDLGSQVQPEMSERPKDSKLDPPALVSCTWAVQGGGSCLRR